MRKTVFAFLALALLAGCAKYGPMYEMPPVADADAVELVIIRESALGGAAVAFAAVVDGVQVFAMESGGYTILKVSPAPHTVTAVFPASPTANTRDNIISINPKAGERLYFLVQPDSIWNQTVKIKRLPAHEGEELIKKSKFQPNF